MKKKTIFLLAACVALLAIGLSFFLLKPVNKVLPIYLVPKNAVFIIDSEKPVRNWKSISESEQWRFLKGNAYFAELTQDADLLDSIINDNAGVLDFIGNQQLLISAHQYKRGHYEFLYIADLGGAARFKGIQKYISRFAGDGYRVTQRQYKGQNIIELYDEEYRETLYLALVENLMLASYTHVLVENAIDEYENPYIGRDVAFVDVSRKIGFDGIFRVYLQYNQMGKYLASLLGQENEQTATLMASLLYSGFAFEMDGNQMKLTGHTNFPEEASSYLKAAYLAGEGTHGLTKLAPARTMLYLTLGFESFSNFVYSLEKVLEDSPEQQKEYIDNRKTVENLLKIDLEKHFIDWVDDELALIQARPKGKGGQVEYLLALEAKDATKAEKSLSFVRQQIKKRTPIKFRDTAYKGYKIHYLSVKGFFKPFLGKLFARFDKPYYTIIDNYVVFSNHPQTIKGLIDDYKNGKVLANEEKFKDFYEGLSSKSSVMAYIDTPPLFESLKNMVSADKWEELDKNRIYVTGFHQMALQLLPADETFASNLLIGFDQEAAISQPIGPSVPALQASSSPEIVAPLKGEVITESPIALDEEATPLSVYTVSGKKARQMARHSEVLEDIAVFDDIAITNLDERSQSGYYENEQLKYKMSLSEGIKEGKFEAYHQNGKLKVKGRYYNDKKSGTWRIYNIFGESMGKLEFENGELLPEK